MSHHFSRTSSKIPSKHFVTEALEDFMIIEQEKEIIRHIISSQCADNEERKESFAKQMELKQLEIIEVRKSSSVQTIFSILCNMVGSSTLALPPNVLKGGLIMSLILMTIIGYVSYKTCSIIILYQRRGELDLSQVVARVLGKKWGKIFCVTSCLLLFILGIIYFLIMNRCLYPITKYFFYLAGSSNYADQQSIDFTKWSIQYQAMILIVPCFALFTLRDLTFVINLRKVGVLAIFGYGLFLIETFIENFINGNVLENWDKLHYFTPNFALVAGSFAMAFFIHNTVCQIVSTNQRQEHNQRDLGIGYIIGYSIYTLVTICGSIGILGRLEDTSQATILIDFYPTTDILPMIVEFLFLTKLITAIPTVNFISRTQFYKLIQEEHVEISNKQFFLYNTFFCLACLTVQIFCIDPSIVIGLNGAICGFFVIYIVPLALRSKCEGNLHNSTIIEELVSGEEFTKYVEDPNFKQSLISFVQSEQQTSYIDYIKHRRYRKMKILEKIAWAAAICFGLGLAAIQVVNIFLN
ncbi:transmembrane amino acid transporter protein (macronuclear) [Tetrahymena thermophila SB210]|uniref:Transmembrane amino acid transporter protein n=1 Tax=Tetrahymena thermophila (strain SB210) TaxID=312017 RepID=I7M8C7_TETTS|nr:transmembrane amino acid transporter protein [Tetrahymena thermophila SB210]EAR97830.2 transmembrane amino acid transporter protein [Tetrahymena thermophila SB210]|eukprot:XP_001018075.2 transmembrane amino acid transporter protein [Tetrahymena thermophila SB210]